MTKGSSPAYQLNIARHDNPAGHPQPVLTRLNDGCWQCRFEAMASPCELLIDNENVSAADVDQAVSLAVGEAWRIENKFSRYVSGNIVHRINNSAGEAVTVDEETAHLLDYANTCFELSGGRFDISSGPLRRLWRFDGGNKIPPQKHIDEVLPLIGWQKCQWRNPLITLPEGAEIDLGGIGKEYAVDRTVQMVSDFLAERCAVTACILVNYGGDIVCSGSRRENQPWLIGIEKTGAGELAPLKLFQGGLATSGDSHRYIDHGGKRYSHVLNPKTGWPVANAPATVTVHAASCTLAGMLATFAILQGGNADAFLQQQGVMYWLQHHPRRKNRL